MFFRSLTTIVLIVIQLGLVNAVHAERDKIGLVLAGGGARGIAHIGVIKYLEEQNIKIDAVAGTSMGSIIAALYASGLSASQIEQVALNLDWAKAFNDSTPRDQLPYREKEQDFDYLIGAKLRFADGQFNLPAGLVEGQNLNFILHDIVSHVSHIRDFDDLPIPYRAVAADVATGEAVVIGEGDLAVAVRASMSLPGIYSPVELDGHLLVDGGIANNLPVDVVKAMGVDHVIVVDISTPLAGKEDLKDVLSLIGQLTSILTRKNTEYQLSLMEEGDLLLVPPMDDYGIQSASFELAETAIKVGYEAALAKAPAFAAYRYGGDAEELIASAPIDLEKPEPIVTDIRVRTDADIPEKLIRNTISQPVGKRLDRKRLEYDISAIWGLDQFSRVDYFMEEEEPGRGVLVINAKANERGISYLRLGLSMDQDTRGDSEFGIRGSWRQKGLNSLGGEWLTVGQVGGDNFFRTELYQPLEEKQQFFASAEFGFSQTKLNIAESGTVFATTELQVQRLDLAAGVNLSNVAQLRFGGFTESAHNDLMVGAPEYSSEHFTGSGFTTSFSLDTLNAPIFPRDGVRVGIQYDEAVKSWGADTNYDALAIAGFGAKSWGRNTLLALMAWSEVNVDNNERSSVVPVGRNSIGGFLNLSGYTKNSLSGNYVGLGSLVFYRRLDEQGILPVDLPVYIGGSLETGNTWIEKDKVSLNDLIFAGSLFLGVDTPIGPVYLGAGMAENDQKALYIQLGQVLD